MFAPNTFTENLLQRKKPQAAMVLDALYSSGAINWPAYDISTIIGHFAIAGIEMGQAVIRKGLRDLCELKLVQTSLIMLKTKGRPALEYRHVSTNEMASILGVKLHEKEFADPVDNADFKTARAYRAKKHYVYLKRTGGRPSRAFLGKRLGVGPRTTQNYEAETDIIVTQMIEREPLKAYDIGFAPKKRISGRFWLQSVYEREMTEEESNEIYKEIAPENRHFFRQKITVTQNFPYTAFILRRELELGRRCYKAWQSTNEYS